MSLEKWKPIIEYQGRRVRGNYEVSSWGNIRNATSGHTIKPLKCRNYYKVIFYEEGTKKRIHIKLHRLVALYFIGEPKPGQEVNHKDGNPHNNSISNLEYVTHQGNIDHYTAARRAMND